MVIRIKNKYITNPIFKKKYSEGYIDLGAAHGIIDFLYIFSLAKKNNIKCNKLDETYNKILEFYSNDNAFVTHRSRELRSLLHGFVSLSSHGYFQTSVDIEESFKLMIDDFVFNISVSVQNNSSISS